MFKNMSLRKRFTTIMIIIYAISLPLIIGASYLVLRENAKKQILEESNLMLAAMEGARGYTAEVLRPALQKVLPDKFIIEGMSATKVAYGIQERVRKKLPRYSFKEATESPLNPVNKADAFELGKINEFRRGIFKDEWRGYKKSSEGEYYVIMRPVKVKPDCLRCHGDPAFAPPEQRERYGDTEEGYNWKIDDIVTVNTVYVPTEEAKKSAIRALLTFAGIYSGIFLIIIIVIDRIIISNIIKPLEHFVATATEVSRGNLGKQFKVKTNDEMKLLADAFERMKMSLMKAMDILKKK
ncbi:MAG: DUF3365 domain-containing protein [Thermodesulfovibrionales bacterium]